MVVCQPGITDVAKSNDTIVCTESTSGVLKPANTSDNASWRCQCFVLPVQPKEAIPYSIFLSLVLLPLNIFIAYSPDSLKEVFMYSAFGMIALVYLVRSLRSLSVASPFLMTDQFHFLLYLCAVEIAPIMILVKLLYV